jgi:hypothetical protein
MKDTWVRKPNALSVVADARYEPAHTKKRPLFAGAVLNHIVELRPVSTIPAIVPEAGKSQRKDRAAWFGHSR